MDALEVARATAEAFRLIDANIGAQTVSVLLTVAQNDGKLMVSDLQKMCDLSRESASRNLTLLSGRTMPSRASGYGFGLVEHRESDVDRRVKYLYLTREGKQMIAKILAAIKAA